MYIIHSVFCHYGSDSVSAVLIHVMHGLDVYVYIDMNGRKRETEKRRHTFRQQNYHSVEPIKHSTGTGSS